MKLALSWSPERISGRLRRWFPDEADVQISHGAIHLALYDPRRRQAINRKLTQRLRTARPIRQPRAGDHLRHDLHQPTPGRAAEVRIFGRYRRRSRLVFSLMPRCQVPRLRHR
ncbi:hypothetical protein [Streptomyces triculaminicus]|uniref:hypothetical protein n=1 Tax=Streptomyces triculaminicus TaxID=2816232 RepID=UPI0037CFF20E